MFIDADKLSLRTSRRYVTITSPANSRHFNCIKKIAIFAFQINFSNVAQYFRKTNFWALLTEY